MFSPTIIWLFLFALLWSQVSANTEIENFEVTEEPEIVIPQTSKWPTFYPGNSEVEWSLELASKDTIISKDCDFSSDLATLCPNEKWMILDLDHNEWRGYSKFTLRISWPASTSASFFIRIHSPESLLTWLSQGEQNSTVKPVNVEHAYIPGQWSRRKYAHVRVVDETDTPTGKQPASSSSRKRVAFRIILEPLMMGILPASVLPTVLVLLLVVSVATLAVPRINGYLEEVAAKAREAGQAHASRKKE